MKNRKITPIILYVLVLALGISMLMGWFGPKNDGLAYSDIISLFENEQVRAFQVQGQQIYLKLYQPYDG